MKNEGNFFNEIEDTLHSYEEAYAPGAWEEFQQKRKRRRFAVLFFRVGSAAAVLLLFTYITVQFFTKAPVTVQLTQTKNISQQSPLKPLQSGQKNVATDNAVTMSKPDNLHHQHGTVRPGPNLAKFAPAINAALAITKAPVNTNNVYGTVQKSIIADTALSKPVNGASQDRVIAYTDIKKYTGATRSVYDSIINSGVNNTVTKATKTNIKNVSYAVVVSPALGNQKVNFGTGLEISYKISNHLFVSSGIAYSSLNATAAGNAGTDPLKKVQGVDLVVSGFEVPIGFQYRTNNGFYVSAGIVGMTVVNNHLNYSYLTENTVATAVVNGAGLTQQAMRVVSEQKTEESKEKINNYLGFYILSVGKKKAVGHNVVNFGPFIRVPFGAVSSEKVNLMQGGIHLGFEF